MQLLQAVPDVLLALGPHADGASAILRLVFALHSFDGQPLVSAAHAVSLHPASGSRLFVSVSFFFALLAVWFARAVSLCVAHAYVRRREILFRYLFRSCSAFSQLGLVGSLTCGGLPLLL